MADTNHAAELTSKGAMRLVLLCLVAWLVLAVAALASGDIAKKHGSRGTHGIVAR